MTIYRGKSLAVEVIWGCAEPIDITGYAACLQPRYAAGRLMLNLLRHQGQGETRAEAAIVHSGRSSVCFSRRA